MKTVITPKSIDAFARFLRAEDRSAGTIENYTRDIASLARWLDGRPLTPEAAALWKQTLAETLAPVTVNAKLAAVNAWCRFRSLGWSVKYLRIQRQLFRDKSRELTKEEYKRLLCAAQSAQDESLALIMQTIASTGIRVSELVYITVEAAKDGRAQIYLKGKIRVILLPARLCRKLLCYARDNGIRTGKIFLTVGGRSFSRKRIWDRMKELCVPARVEPSKVYPHNLRHLFAGEFYRATNDVVSLADLLGHSSVETTRLYLRSTGEDYVRFLDTMDLVQ